MIVAFTKYQGTGNDFIIIDNRLRQFDHLDVALMCHPKFGIGADGLMLLQNASGYDFEMVYYNSDGRISSMCGNGGRCLVDFAKKLDVFQGTETNFIATDGPHKAHWSETLVELQMKDVQQIEVRESAYVMNTGSPHYVAYTSILDTIDILPRAREIRYNTEFKSDGINVNFVEVTDDKHIRVRTYERGVENETLSCGTGVTACAISMALHTGKPDGRHTVYIDTPGGKLHVKYTLSNTQAKDVWLCGPATKVFEGQIEI